MLRRSVAAAAVAAMLCCLLPGGARAADLLVFAAASLRDALDEVAAAYGAQGGGTIRAAYASSSTLARQIAQGAEADVFISANVEWMDYLAERRLIRDGSRSDLLSNELVLVAPKDGAGEPLDVKPGFDLAAVLAGGRLAMGDPDHVPAGIYGRQALEHLGVWEAVSGSIARTDNVRAALALVARGETPFGIVYRSDAVADPAVRVVGRFPAGSHRPIVYPVAITAARPRPEAAAFLRFLRSPAAEAIFVRHGFLPIG